MGRMLGVIIAATLSVGGVASAQPRLNGPLFPPLPEEMITAMSDAVQGCDGKFKQLMGRPPTGQAKKICAASPIPLEQQRTLIEAGRITGLLEACGEVAPSIEVLPKAMAGVEALPNYGPEVEYFSSALHGFARGLFRESFVANRMCQSGDFGERTHYVALAREHLTTFVLPKPAAE